MPRSRSTSNPISYHKWTKQFYVTRTGRRIYLGSEKEEALKRYHRLGLGFVLIQQGALWLFGVRGNGTGKDLKEKI